MAKRRITLSSQEMNEINSRTKTLESQLQRSNARVDQLESGLGIIKELMEKKTKIKDQKTLLVSLQQLVDKAINPPVAAKEALELEAAAQA